ncbi:hypothetical protein [Pseudoalteromonas spongiae]|uniref:hypothetical protein n=1 Tax=Pseudoalteromonas spongiae TaxID=298657 RepID=UPI00110B179B|nr:hypothetical protein [Pseudoalteromonas spongiae]TMO82800.1 hypothetical protein CWC15_18095 [Pseudoalteromonas spongiae]
MGKLSRQENNLKALKDKFVIGLDELMSPKFISEHSKFENIDNLIEASGVVIDSKGDKTNFDDEWDKFISNNTSFDSWENMYEAAGATYTGEVVLNKKNGKS